MQDWIRFDTNEELKAYVRERHPDCTFERSGRYDGHEVFIWNKDGRLIMKAWDYVKESILTGEY